jgi:hypothetical protein
MLVVSESAQQACRWSRRSLAVFSGKFPAALLHLLGAEQFRTERAVPIDGAIADVARMNHPQYPRRTPSILVGHCCSRRCGSFDSIGEIDRQYVSPRA